MLTRENNCSQRNLRKNRRLLLASSILALSIICTNLCSCDNNNIKPTTTDESKQVSMQEPISSDSLWYDAERIELKIFPDGRETIITQSLFDYYNGEIRAVLQYYALPVEGIEGSESSGTALCVFDNTGALKKSVDINSLIADANTPYVSMRTCGFDKDKLYVLAQDVTTDSRGFLIAIDINSERQISKTEFTGTSAQEICSFLPDRLMIVVISGMPIVIRAV